MRGGSQVLLLYYYYKCVSYTTTNVFSYGGGGAGVCEEEGGRSATRESAGAAEQHSQLPPPQSVTPPLPPRPQAQPQVPRQLQLEWSYSPILVYLPLVKNAAVDDELGTQFSCFTSTKVQILTQETRRSGIDRVVRPL